MNTKEVSSIIEDNNLCLDIFYETELIKVSKQNR